MPFPSDHSQEADDCFRCAIACYMDMSPKRVPYFKPRIKGKNDIPSFWPKYVKWAEERLGLKLIRFEEKEAIEHLMQYDHKKWIAQVPSLNKKRAKDGVEHAIVMKGAKLFYDPNQEMGRKRKPRKINYAIVLATEWKEHSDGTVTFVY